jgi:hypothetical protein
MSRNLVESIYWRTIEGSVYSFQVNLIINLHKNCVSQKKYINKLEIKKKIEAQCRSPFILLWGNCIQNLLWSFNRCFLPSFGSFGRAGSEEKIFKNRPIRNKNWLWWPCLSVNKHSRHRQFLFLIGQFLKTISSETALPNKPKFGRKHHWKVFYKECSVNKELRVTAIFVDGSRQYVQSLVRTFQFSFHLAEGFQRRRLKCEKLTDNRLYTTNDQ